MKIKQLIFGISLIVIGAIGLSGFKADSEATSTTMGADPVCEIYGKIKIVEYGEDYKVKIVDYGEDLKIKWVDYGEENKGKWKKVDYGEKFKIKWVTYGEDFKIKEVTYGEGC